MKKGKKYGIALLGVLSVCLIGLLILWWQHSERVEENFLPAKAAGNSYSVGWVKYPQAEYLEFTKNMEEAAKEKYTGLLLTSYRCRALDKEALEWGFGVHPIQAVWRSGSAHEVRTILEQAFQKPNHIQTVFLELDPRQHNDPELIKWIQKHKGVKFFIFFSPYPDEYWQKLYQSGGIKERLTDYEELAETLYKFHNVNLFWFDNQEWMTKNPLFFEDGTQLSADALSQVYSAFGSGAYRIAGKEFIPAMTQKKYADFSDKVIFVFGDSMFGKDRDQSGVAEVAAGLLNAEVLNAAIGGSSAAGAQPRDLNNVLDLLLDWEQEKDRLKTPEYQEQIPLEAAQALMDMQEVKPDYIILGYGYNDYIAQYPLESDEEGRQISFQDALRENIRRLKQAYPNAKMIVSTAVPSSVEFNLEISLEEYAKAAKAVAEEEGVFCLYNYETGELTTKNLEWLLSDGVHFGVAGRFVQAGRITEFLENIAQ